MIYNDIKNFARQFEFNPKIENKSALKKKYKGYIVAGMGGSHLAADILKCWQPECKLTIWQNYGLPPIEPKEFKKYLIIASSYSGNTEETIDALKLALKRKCPVAVIASGGKLLELARKEKIPHIALPRLDIQPRMALGFSIKALLALMDEKTLLRETQSLSKTLKPSLSENRGKNLARKFKNKVPLIYASYENRALAKIWKIKFNETGKIPAFWTVFPEMNHNEMTGFDIQKTTHGLSKNFHAIVLRDEEDNARITKRMDILASLYKKRGLPVEKIDIKGSSRLHKIFSSIILADWTSYYTAKLYNTEPEAVAMVEQFKKLIRN